MCRESLEHRMDARGCKYSEDRPIAVEYSGVVCPFASISPYLPMSASRGVGRVYLPISPDVGV